MALYLWNVAVGQSFHFPLQAVEVALRNVTGQAIVNLYGTGWWSDAICRRMLGPERCADIDKACTRIRKKYHVQPHSDQIIASLMFGFWAALLKKRYNKPIWNQSVATAFPHLRPGTIRDISQTANAVQDFRNRIFHHEPLIGRSLLDDYSNIMTLLGWICPETREWVRHHTSVPTVIRQRP